MKQTKYTIFFNNEWWIQSLRAYWNKELDIRTGIVPNATLHILTIALCASGEVGKFSLG